MLSIVLVVLAVFADIALTHLFRHGLTRKSQWIDRMRHEHYDMAIAGSSRALWNIDHDIIDSSCGLRTINMASPGFYDSETLLLLKMFLANGNTVDRLLLQVDHGNLRRGDALSRKAYDFLPMLEDSLVYQHYRDRGKEWFPLRTVPFLRYGRYNFIWGPEEALMTISGRRHAIFDNKGSFFTDMRFRGTPHVNYYETNYAVGDDLQGMIDLCCENGIVLELFMSPYYRLRLTEEALHAYEALLQRHDLVLHDFSHRLDSTIYFDDNMHVSRQGGQLFTDMLAKEVICPPTRSRDHDICGMRGGS